LVEGDAERFLVPAFAKSLGIHLDQLGISVCSVAGTNFKPYVKLLGTSGLAIPHVVLTDLDPNGENPPLARRRVIDILELVEPGPAYDGLADNAIFMRGEDHGVFVNGGTLETGLFLAGMGPAIARILGDELPLRRTSRERLAGWVANPETIDGERLINAIERIGKGRFAQRLAPRVTAVSCPDYIQNALERIRDAVP
jgi:putative ATP-dependent endonuclease of OLD family